jgi:hypothetical protein
MRVLRGLGGRMLPCGCLVGTYETYDGEVVTTIDAPGARCVNSRHRLHQMVPPGVEANPLTLPQQTGRTES